MGNGERIKIDDHDDLIDVFLDYLIHILAECFAPFSGWKHCLEYVISLIDGPEQLYHEHVEIQEKVNEKDGHDAMEEEELGRAAS